MECWNVGILENLNTGFLEVHHSIIPILRYSTIPEFHRLSLSPLVRQGLLDDIANHIELFDPFGIQPEKLGSFNPACSFAYFFFRDILPQGIVESSGLLIVVEPSRLSLPRQEPVDGDFRGVGMGRAIEKAQGAIIRGYGRTF